MATIADKSRTKEIINRLQGIINNASPVPLASGIVTVHKDEVLTLLTELEQHMDVEIKTYHEVNDRKGKILNEAKRDAERIIYEAEQTASRMRVSKRATRVAPLDYSTLNEEERSALDGANEIYAASMIYTDEMLTEVTDLIKEAYDNIFGDYQIILEALHEKLSILANNRQELMVELQDMEMEDRGQQILEIGKLLSSELYHERMKKRQNSDQYEDGSVQLSLDLEDEQARMAEEQESRAKYAEEQAMLATQALEEMKAERDALMATVEKMKKEGLGQVIRDGRSGSSLRMRKWAAAEQKPAQAAEPEAPAAEAGVAAQETNGQPEEEEYEIVYVTEDELAEGEEYEIEYVDEEPGGEYEAGYAQEVPDGEYEAGYAQEEPEEEYEIVYVTEDELAEGEEYEIEYVDEEPGGEYESGYGTGYAEEDALAGQDIEEDAAAKDGGEPGGAAQAADVSGSGTPADGGKAPGQAEDKPRTARVSVKKSAKRSVGMPGAVKNAPKDAAVNGQAEGVQYEMKLEPEHAVSGKELPAGEPKASADSPLVECHFKKNMTVAAAPSRKVAGMARAMMTEKKYVGLILHAVRERKDPSGANAVAQKPSAEKAVSEKLSAGKPAPGNPSGEKTAIDKQASEKQRPAQGGLIRRAVQAREMAEADISVYDPDSTDSSERDMHLLRAEVSSASRQKAGAEKPSASRQESGTGKPSADRQESGAEKPSAGRQESGAEKSSGSRQKTGTSSDGAPDAKPAKAAPDQQRSKQEAAAAGKKEMKPDAHSATGKEAKPAAPQKKKPAQDEDIRVDADGNKYVQASMQFDEEFEIMEFD